MMRTLREDMQDTVKMFRKSFLENRDAAIEHRLETDQYEWYSGLSKAFQECADEIEYRLSKLECNLTTPA